MFKTPSTNLVLGIKVWSPPVATCSSAYVCAEYTKRHDPLIFSSSAYDYISVRISKSQSSQCVREVAIFLKVILGIFLDFYSVQLVASGTEFHSVLCYFRMRLLINNEFGHRMQFLINHTHKSQKKDVNSHLHFSS